MIYVTCTSRYRDRNNRITHYIIKDTQGKYITIRANDLKAAIRAKKIRVSNLILTSDNKLISTEQILEKKKEVDLKYKVDKLIDRVKILGGVQKIKTACGIPCTLINISNTNHIIYIPDDVSRLNLDVCNLTFTSNIQGLHGSIEVIGGGKNLYDIRYMFVNCIADKIDISGLNTQELYYASALFANCGARYININNLNTSKVSEMYRMFQMCKAKVIGLDKLNTGQVSYMNDMFNGSVWDVLDLSSFDTRCVRTFTGMFANCKINRLNLSSFNGSCATGMRAMFYKCDVPYIDLSHFVTSSVTDISSMFKYCKADVIDLSHFDSVNLQYHSDVFTSCNSKLLATDAKLLALYNKRNK